MSYQDTLNKIIRGIGKACAEKWQAFDADSTELRVDFGGLYSTWHEAAVDEAELREFCYAYAERFPDDAEFQETFYEHGIFDPESLPDSAAQVFYNSDRWQYPWRDAATAYVRELFEFVSREYDFPQPLRVESIDWTRDNFSRPDLAVLAPIGWENYAHVLNWLGDNPDEQEWLVEQVQYMTTPRDGYAPYYSFDEVIADAYWIVRLLLERMAYLCYDHDNYQSKWNWFEYFSMNGSELPVNGEIKK
jgi:hypothetical protein